MSNKTVKPETLAQAVKQYLEIYVEDIGEDVEETANKMGNEAKKELKEESHKLFKGTGNYAKGWSVRKDKTGKSYYVVKVWNRTNYQLTHLLEFGHATRNGGRTRAFPHIRPVEEKYSREFLKELEKKIRRTK